MSIEQDRIVGNQGHSTNQLTGEKSTVDVVMGERFWCRNYGTHWKNRRMVTVGCCEVTHHRFLIGN